MVGKRDIAAACPDISQTTIDRVLSNLLAGGKSRRREPALRQGTYGKDRAVTPIAPLAYKDIYSNEDNTLVEKFLNDYPSPIDAKLYSYAYATT